ncbi:hypothetical protein MKMG_02034 [Methanogenium sp. MK-MG]|nr:hypothetical protein MKMG_02034 [Methanogenium sp. MK-MG]
MNAVSSACPHLRGYIFSRVGLYPYVGAFHVHCLNRVRETFADDKSCTQLSEHIIARHLIQNMGVVQVEGKPVFPYHVIGNSSGYAIFHPYSGITVGKHLNPFPCVEYLLYIAIKYIDSIGWYECPYIDLLPYMNG